MGKNIIQELKGHCFGEETTMYYPSPKFNANVVLNHNMSIEQYGRERRSCKRKKK